MVYRELNKALNVIKEECDKHKECWNCPFYGDKGVITTCMLVNPNTCKFSDNIAEVQDKWDKN